MIFELFLAMLRHVETQLGYRYLTHESDDERWANYEAQLQKSSKL